MAGTDQHSVVCFPLSEVVSEQTARREREQLEETMRLTREAATAAVEERRLGEEAAAEEGHRRREAGATREDPRD